MLAAAWKFAAVIPVPVLDMFWTAAVGDGLFLPASREPAHRPTCGFFLGSRGWMPLRMHSRRNSDSLSCSFFSAWLRVTYWTALPDVPCRRQWRRRVAGRHGAHAWRAHGCLRPALHPSGWEGQGTGAPRAPCRAAAQRPLTFFFFSMLVSLFSYPPVQTAAVQAAAPLRAPFSPAPTAALPEAGLMHN